MCWYEQLDEKVREYLPDMTMEREVPLSKHTSVALICWWTTGGWTRWSSRRRSI